MKRRTISIIDSKNKKTRIAVLAVIGFTMISINIVMALDKPNKAELISSSEVAEFINSAQIIDNTNDHLIGTEVKDHTPLLMMKSSSEVSASQNIIKSFMPENTIIKKLADDTVLSPISITNFEVIDSVSPEIIIPNGSVALFTQEDDSGWTCKVGDKLIYEFEKYKSDIISSQMMIIGYALDGVLYPGEKVKELGGKYQLEINEDGDYYIYVISATSDYLALKEGTINIIK